MLKDKAVEIDSVSALDTRLFLKGMSVNCLVLKSILSSFKNDQTSKNKKDKHLFIQM